MENQDSFDSPQAGLPPKPAPEGGLPPSSDDKNLAMLAHLLGALIGFLGPLIMWLIKKDESSFVDDQGKEALNFQLTMLLGYLVATPVGILFSCFTFGLSMFLPVVVVVLQIVFGIIGALSASRGEYYRYPLSIRFIK